MKKDWGITEKSAATARRLAKLCFIEEKQLFHTVAEADQTELMDKKNRRFVRSCPPWYSHRPRSAAIPSEENT